MRSWTGPLWLAGLALTLVGTPRRQGAPRRWLGLGASSVLAGQFAVPVQHDLETREKAFGSHYLYRVGIAGQGDRLANGRKRATDCTILDLVSLTIESRADSCCES